MTPKQALEWLIEEFGTVEADAILSACIQDPNQLEVITVGVFDATDPCRQKLRQSVRILIEEMKGLK